MYKFPKIDAMWYAWQGCSATHLANSGNGEGYGERLWLWRNFVDGRPEYWAFDNAYPCYANGDPITLGEPCGYALLRPSTDGRPGAAPTRPTVDRDGVLENWIPVAERVPEPYIKRVFTLSDDGEVSAAEFPSGWEGMRKHTYITHWMHVPLAPSHPSGMAR
jgi:hypothetical protein